MDALPIVFPSESDRRAQTRFALLNLVLDSLSWRLLLLLLLSVMSLPIVAATVASYLSLRSLHERWGVEDLTDGIW